MLLFFAFFLCRSKRLEYTHRALPTSPEGVLLVAGNQFGSPNTLHPD